MGSVRDLKASRLPGSKQKKHKAGEQQKQQQQQQQPAATAATAASDMECLSNGISVPSSSASAAAAASREALEVFASCAAAAAEGDTAATEGDTSPTEGDTVKAEDIFAACPYSQWRFLHLRLRRSLVHHGFHKPTKIQLAAIPTLLHGHDALIQCPTGKP